MTAREIGGFSPNTGLDAACPAHDSHEANGGSCAASTAGPGQAPQTRVLCPLIAGVSVQCATPSEPESSSPANEGVRQLCARPYVYVGPRPVSSRPPAGSPHSRSAGTPRGRSRKRPEGCFRRGPSSGDGSTRRSHSAPRTQRPTVIYPHRSRGDPAPLWPDRSRDDSSACSFSDEIRLPISVVASRSVAQYTVH